MYVPEITSERVLLSVCVNISHVYLVLLTGETENRCHVVYGVFTGTGLAS